MLIRVVGKCKVCRTGLCEHATFFSHRSCTHFGVGCAREGVELSMSRKKRRQEERVGGCFAGDPLVH